MAAGFSRMEALCLSAVLQDCLDQLEVLGNITPLRTKVPSNPADAAQRGAMPAQNISNRLVKLHRDREFLEQVVRNLLEELKENQTFCSLLQTVEEETRRRAEEQNLVTREEDGRRQITELQKQLVDIRTGAKQDVQRLEQLTAHLKDELHKMNMKTSLENQYVESRADLKVHQTQKLNQLKEKDLERQIQNLSSRIQEEQRIHQVTCTFLQQQQTLLDAQLEQVMERYDKHTEQKEKELSSLKIRRTQSLARLEELSHKYREAEEVVIKDRKEKEELRKLREKEEQENWAACTIQSWWKGCMFRLGIFPNKKEKKGAKEGKKKGKKKK